MKINMATVTSSLYRDTEMTTFLTLILPTPNVNSLCHQYKARPACTSVHNAWPCSILLAGHLQVFILISLKTIMDSSKNARWNIPFKKFGMVRVKTALLFF